MLAERMKTCALQALSAEGAINAYQWCKALLSKDHPEGLVAVQRFEAASKFFHSFSVVLTILALIFAFHRQWTPALICTGFLLPALWRYVDQRFKTTQQAYWFVIMLEGMKQPSMMKQSSGPAISPCHRPDSLTHAGGVVFRKRASPSNTCSFRPAGIARSGYCPKGISSRERTRGKQPCVRSGKRPAIGRG